MMTVTALAEALAAALVAIGGGVADDVVGGRVGDDVVAADGAVGAVGIGAEDDVGPRSSVPRRDIRRGDRLRADSRGCVCVPTLRLENQRVSEACVP